MPEYEVFPNAPVEEAIITILLPELDDLGSRFERVSASLASAYPVVEPAGEADPRVPEPTDPSSEPRSTGGIRLFSSDRQQAVQITAESFSFHRLRPYPRWSVFSQAAREAWEAFADPSEPEPVAGVRLRYVNAFQLPLPFEDWSDYLLIRPEVPSLIDTGLSSYVMTLNLEDLHVPARAVVTQATSAVRSGVVPVVLDIDARSMLRPWPGGKPGAVWRVLEDLREYKNRLFFEGLTERAKELFR